MSFIGHKIVGKNAPEGVYQAGHYGFFYVRDGLTSDPFPTRRRAVYAFNKETDMKTSKVKAPGGKHKMRGSGKVGKMERGFRPTSDAKKAGKREKRLEGKGM